MEASTTINYSMRSHFEPLADANWKSRHVRTSIDQSGGGEHATGPFLVVLFRLN
jgi:hypothetical protein